MQFTYQYYLKLNFISSTNRINVNLNVSNFWENGYFIIIMLLLIISYRNGSMPDNITLVISKSIFYQQHLNVLNILICRDLKRSRALHILHMSGSFHSGILFSGVLFSSIHIYTIGTFGSVIYVPNPYYLPEMLVLIYAILYRDIRYGLVLNSSR